jgi:hypothetical protein
MLESPKCANSSASNSAKPSSPECVTSLASDKLKLSGACRRVRKHVQLSGASLASLDVLLTFENLAKHSYRHSQPHNSNF